MKTKKLKLKPDRRIGVYMTFASPTVIRALSRMNVAFPLLNARKTTLWRLQKEKMAEQLVLLALAHIEVIAPRFRAMIGYCEAEGMNQTEYLESLIRAKFAKNLHIAGRKRRRRGKRRAVE